MNYSDELKVFWITPMRTATRTCAELQKILNFDMVGQHFGFLSKEKFDYNLVLNIRSPYPRMVSLYHLFNFHYPNSSLMFEPWVNMVTTMKYHTLSVYDFYLDEIVKKSIKPPDYYVRTEFLNEDLRKLPFVKNNLNKLDNFFQNQVIHNKYVNEFGNRKPWKEYYTQEISDIVYSKMEEQFKLFNYNKDYWKDGTP